MKKKIIARIIFLILIIGIFSTIFGFSSQDGDESKAVSRKVMKEIVDIFPQTKYLSEAEKEAIVEKSQPFIRKTAHFTVYMISGFLIMGFLNTYDLDKKEKIKYTLIVGIAYAVLDELHQGITGGRKNSKDI